jgi:hypothetical protein
VWDVLAIEVTAGAVRCLRLTGLGRARAVRAYREQALPSGLVVPSSTAPNVQDEGAFARTLRQAMGPRPPRRARLVLPDRTVRLHILNTDAVPPRGPDLRRFLVWRLQEVLPFAPGEARVSYLMAPNGLPDRRMAIALVAREPVLAQYERLLREAGTGVAHLAPAACHLFNLAAAHGESLARGVHAFLALGIESATAVLSVRGIPHYARTFLRPCVPLEAPPAPDPRPPMLAPHRAPATAVPELLEELARSFHHAEEEIGLARPERLCLAGDLGRDAALAAALQGGLGIPSIPFSPPPPRTLRRRGLLPPQAQALLSAALFRL